VARLHKGAALLYKKSFLIRQGTKKEEKRGSKEKQQNKKEKKNRRLSRILPSHYSYHTRDVDRQMH
jgi:hypothetical protein